MKQIELTQGYVAIVDDADFERVSGVSWVAHRGHSGIYAQGRVEGRVETLHRYLVGCVPGDRLTVDHANHDTLDNRRENLRVCTFAENAKNRKRHKQNKSGFKGVHFDDSNRTLKHWRAMIAVDKKMIVLGRFATKELAAQAYDEAARKYHGNFAFTNSPAPAA